MCWNCYFSFFFFLELLFFKVEGCSDGLRQCSYETRATLFFLWITVGKELVTFSINVIFPQETHYLYSGPGAAWNLTAGLALRLWRNPGAGGEERASGLPLLLQKQFCCALLSASPLSSASWSAYMGSRPVTHTWGGKTKEWVCVYVGLVARNENVHRFICSFCIMLLCFCPIHVLLCQQSRVLLAGPYFWEGTHCNDFSSVSRSFWRQWDWGSESEFESERIKTGKLVERLISPEIHIPQKWDGARRITVVISSLHTVIAH